MEITLIQVLLMLFALFAWAGVIRRLRNKAISVGEFSFWSLIWLTVLIVALFPGVMGGISQIMGIGRSVDLAVYVSIILLFYLIFRMYVRIDSQKKDITKLVREIAITDAKSKNVRGEKKKTTKPLKKRK